MRIIVLVLSISACAQSLSALGPIVAALIGIPTLLAGGAMSAKRGNIEQAVRQTLEQVDGAVFYFYLILIVGGIVFGLLAAWLVVRVWAARKRRKTINALNHQEVRDTLSRLKRELHSLEDHLVDFERRSMTKGQLQQ